jgi:hypothetical protein
MSDEKTMMGGTPIVTFKDAVEFFDKRAPHTVCPICRYHKWTILAPTDGKAGLISFGLPGVKLSTGDLLMGGAPIMLVTCKKCAFMRAHAMTEISKWIEAGKPEFKEDE